MNINCDNLMIKTPSKKRCCYKTTSNKSVESMHNKITILIHSSVEKITLTKQGPKKNIVPFKRVPHWNAEINNAIRNRSRASNKWQRRRTTDLITEYRKLRAIAQITVRTYAKHYWRQYCDTLNNTSKPAAVWKNIRRMHGIGLHTNRAPFCLTDDDGKKLRSTNSQSFPTSMQRKTL